MENKSEININWFDLFGKSYDKIQTVLNPYIGEVKKEEKKFPSEKEEFLYQSFLDLGISLSFKDSFLFSVFLYAELDKKFKKFKGTLPYNVNLSMKAQEIFCKFAEPSQKSGGKMLPITLSYENFGIEFTFITNNWGDFQSPISFVCLFKPENNPEKYLCGVCLKKYPKFECQKCGFVKYCGEECKATLAKFHKD